MPFFKKENKLICVSFRWDIAKYFGPRALRNKGHWFIYWYFLCIQILVTSTMTLPPAKPFFFLLFLLFYCAKNVISCWVLQRPRTTCGVSLGGNSCGRLNCCWQREWWLTWASVWWKWCASCLQTNVLRFGWRKQISVFVTWERQIEDDNDVVRIWRDRDIKINSFGPGEWACHGLSEKNARKWRAGGRFSRESVCT